MTKKDKQMLRMVFEAWREYTVESHASRFRKSLSLEQRGQLNSPVPAFLCSYSHACKLLDLIQHSAMNVYADLVDCFKS